MPGITFQHATCLADALFAAEAGVPAGTVYTFAPAVPAGTHTAVTQVTETDGSSRTCPVGG